MPSASFDPPWNERVRFDPAGGFAYVPNTAIVRDSVVDEDFVRELLGPGEGVTFDDDPTTEFRAMSGTFDTIRVVSHLRAKGIDAQPEHVLFAHGTTCGCCGPHPAAAFDPGFVANPFHANPFHANPFHANPFHANPFHANPFHANPFHANSADPNGPSRSSARPANAPGWYSRAEYQNATTSEDSPPTESPQVVVLDTGLATTDLPEFLQRARVSAAVNAAGQQRAPDVADSTRDGWLDPVAGHGTFIAGVIERIAPGCMVEIRRVLGPQGEGKESEIVDAIDDIALAEKTPDFLNLSFGGFVWEKAPMLSAAILRAQQRGIVVVASAGNDSTCRPSFPAAIPGVVSVGAIGPDGPAWFSNYGDWVRACAPGVDVVSAFFASFDGLEVPSAGRDIDSFRAWATWSGTSFAAPAVVGALVREMRATSCTQAEAVDRLIDAPWLGRIPGLGTVVNV
jgi:Subtilase family